MASTQQFRQPISAELPCGIDLSTDPLMRHLRSIMVGKVDEKVVTDEYGDRRVEATREEPDWRDVRKNCEEALGKSKHLEVFVDYAAALLMTEGLPGAADALELLAAVVKEFWPSLHPMLDPEDDNDPSQRFGLIENLSLLPAMDDPIRFVGRLRETPLAEVRGLGVLNLSGFKDGYVPQPGTPEATPVVSLIGALRAAHGQEKLNQGAQAVERLRAAAKSIYDTLGEMAGGRTPDFELLNKTLDMQHRFFQWYGNAEAAGGGEATAAESAPGVSAGFEPGGAIVGTVGIAIPAGQIASPAQVIDLLDKICTYYAKVEPSSPVPLLLRRARNLVGKNFMEVVSELAGGSLEQIQVITGETFPEKAS